MNNHGFRLAASAFGAALAMVWLVPASARGQALDSFSIGSSFQGLSQISMNTPPDTDGAIGPNAFVESVNGSIAVYNPTTGVQVSVTPALTFWSNLGIDLTGRLVFDPRIVYDAPSGHWFASSIDSASQGANGALLNHYLVAVSNTSDPTQGWKGFAINSSSSGDHWADFDTLGVNANGVYLAANMVNSNPSSPLNGQIDKVNFLVLPKTDLINGSVANATLMNNVDPSTTGFSVQPIVSLTNSGMPHAMIGDDGSDMGQLKFTQINGPVTAPTLNTASPFQQNLPTTTPANNTPPAAPQPGTTTLLDTNDTRSSASVVLSNGNIWAIENANFNGRSALHWERIDPSTGLILDKGYIANNVQSYYFGSIAVNNNGDIVIGFTASDGTSTFPSAYALVGKFDGASTNFGTPFLLHAGDASFGPAGTVTRWGDYSATTIDPNNPNAFWTIQEFAVSDPNGGPGQESTWITEIVFAPAVPEPSSLALGVCGAIGLGVLVRRRRSRGA